MTKAWNTCSLGILTWRLKVGPHLLLARSALRLITLVEFLRSLPPFVFPDPDAVSLNFLGCKFLEHESLSITESITLGDGEEKID